MKIEEPLTDMIVRFVTKHVKDGDLREAAKEASLIAVFAMKRTAEDMRKALERSLLDRTRELRRLIIGEISKPRNN